MSGNFNKKKKFKTYKILTLLSVEPEPVELHRDVSPIVSASVPYQLALEAHFLEYHFDTQCPRKVRKKMKICIIDHFKSTTYYDDITYTWLSEG